MRCTAYKFSEYVEHAIEELPGEVVRTKSTREAKKLIEEYRPLSRLALFFKCPGLEVEVETTIEGSDADGIIYERGFRDGELHIQIAHSYDYEEALRMELLNEQGHAPGTGPIFRDKKTREIKVVLTATNTDENFDRVSAEIERLYNLKLGKNYKNKMVLLISFSEFKLSGLNSWVRLYNKLNHVFEESSSNFISVYLFNQSSNEIYRIA